MSRKFGEFGGQYVPETLMNPLIELEKQFKTYCTSKAFKEEFSDYLREYVGRPSLLYHAKRLSEKTGGAKIYLKREDLNHTGAHKINNVLAKSYLQNIWGKKELLQKLGQVSMELLPLQ